MPELAGKDQSVWSDRILHSPMINSRGYGSIRCNHFSRTCAHLATRFAKGEQYLLATFTGKLGL